jgi:3-oxoacyl-[acyl-carrier protein] reductase
MPVQHGELPISCRSSTLDGTEPSELTFGRREVSLEDFEQTLNLNLRASFILTKGLVGPMRAQRWGRIVFVSSIAAYGGGINGPHYAASKGGLTGLMKNLSTRLAEFNISVSLEIVLGCLK